MFDGIGILVVLVMTRTWDMDKVTNKVGGLDAETDGLLPVDIGCDIVGVCMCTVDGSMYIYTCDRLSDMIYSYGKFRTFNSIHSSTSLVHKIDSALSFTLLRISA